MLLGLPWSIRFIKCYKMRNRVKCWWTNTNCIKEMKKTQSWTMCQWLFNFWQEECGHLNTKSQSNYHHLLSFFSKISNIFISRSTMVVISHGPLNLLMYNSKQNTLISPIYSNWLQLRHLFCYFLMITKVWQLKRWPS